MDGNGRWATDRGLSRSDGHRAGTENVRRTIESFAQAGVRYLTLYAFSTENWERPSDEVDTLISIIQEVIGPESENLHNMGVRIRHIGSLSRLSDEMRGAIEYSTALTQDNERLTLCVAFNYGARAEILEAVRRILREGVDPETVTERSFADYLDTAGIPDPDLVIRTAGEMRLSNFLLWQSAYAEFYSTSALWPDFDAAEVDKAIDAYRRRRRKFGRIED
jgi:undecaprenyl diphosphate synthase